MKTALITGASSGIGKELAKIHAAHKDGGNLVLVARSKDKLEQLKQQLEKEHAIKAMVIAQDLGAEDASQKIYEQVKAADIEVDYLINNAGFGGMGKFHQRPWADDRAMIQLNIVALTHLCRLFLPDMVAKDSGKILNVSSTASFMPGPLQAVYFATKAYVTYFSNAIAEELGNTNVSVTNLMPGATETEFGRISGMDKTELFAKTADAKQVAADGYQGMLEGKLDVISGLTLSQRIMLAAVPFAPKKLLLKQMRHLQKHD